MINKIFLAIFLLILSTIVNAIPNNCVGLLYHHFSDKTPKSTSVSPKLFEQHLKYLKENNFQILPLSEVITKLKNKQKLADKCVFITIDDAYISIYNNAYPLIKKYNTPVSVFVSTEQTDKGYKAIMTWDQMREIQGDLVSFYNHSRNHSHLTEQSITKTHAEVLYAAKRLQEELSVKDKFFAYPYGEYDKDTYDLLTSLGYVSFGQQSGAIGENSDFSALPRFPMAANYAKMKSFKLKVNTLAFPILSEKPINSVITNDLKPKLIIIFNREINKKEQHSFNCFVSGQQNAEVIWKNSKHVIIRAKENLNFGRSRYNCTMLSRFDKRFYWYSKQWLNSSRKD